jgi:hypothetical protein
MAIAMPRKLQHAKTGAVNKLEVIILLSQFLPEPPNAKGYTPPCRIVEEDNSARRQLWQPCLKLVPNGFVVMKPVDVY